MFSISLNVYILHNIFPFPHYNFWHYFSRTTVCLCSLYRTILQIQWSCPTPSPQWGFMLHQITGKDFASLLCSHKTLCLMSLCHLWLFNVCYIKFPRWYFLFSLLCIYHTTYFPFLAAITNTIFQVDNVNAEFLCSIIYFLELKIESILMFRAGKKLFSGKHLTKMQSEPHCPGIHTTMIIQCHHDHPMLPWSLVTAGFTYGNMTARDMKLENLPWKRSWFLQAYEVS